MVFANLMRQPVILNLFIITTELSVYGSVSDPQYPAVLEYSQSLSNLASGAEIYPFKVLISHA